MAAGGRADGQFLHHGGRDRPRPACAPPPPVYNAEVRYQIDAFRNEHAAQFQEMVRSLEAVGLSRDLGPEDEAENSKVTHMSGTIQSSRARRLLLESHVKTIRLQPQGSKVPGDASPVRVQLELAAGFDKEPGRFLYELATVRGVEQEGGPRLERQWRLAKQVREVLATLGFHEAAGYDRRAHTRLVGTVPANQLPALLEDLRRQPGAWQLPNDPPIDSILLAGLRRYPQGAAVLDGILRDWNNHPAGTKLLDKVVAQWSKTQVAREFLSTLPAELREHFELSKPFLLTQMAQRPEADALLQQLLKDVLALPAPGAPELMDMVLKRLAGQPAAQSLPMLLRTESPIRTLEVMPAWPLPADRPVAAAPPQGQEKLTPDLRGHWPAAETNRSGWK